MTALSISIGVEAQQRRAATLSQVDQFAALLATSAKSSLHLPLSESPLWAEVAQSTPVSPGGGSPVGSCDDYSGNGNHFTQSTADSRPAAYLGLYFDGVQSSMTMAFPGGAGSNSMSVIMVVKPTNTQFCLVSDADASASTFIGLAQSGSSSTDLIGAGVNAGVGSVWVDGTEYADGTATRGQLYTALVDGAWHVVEVRQISMLGQSGLDIGRLAAAGGSNYMDGAIAMFAVADAADMGSNYAAAWALAQSVAATVKAGLA